MPIFLVGWLLEDDCSRSEAELREGLSRLLRTRKTELFQEVKHHVDFYRGSSQHVIRLAHQVILVVVLPAAISSIRCIGHVFEPEAS